MNIGFTGSRMGLAAAQYDALETIFRRLGKEHTLHHGDCVGADQTAHLLARACDWKVIVHPPDNPLKRAGCTGDRVHAPAPYLERNRQIVKESALLVACPDDSAERLRSGTWATVRMARKAGITVLLIFPDGSVRNEYPAANDQGPNSLGEAL